MKNYIYLTLILFGLIGCGGGGGSSDSASSAFSGNFPTQNFSGTSFNAWDYIVPSDNVQVNSINGKNLGGNDYNADFSVTSTSVTEIPQNANNEKIIYDKLANSIKISFYKDDVRTFSYDMKKSIHIGETTTVLDSACVLVNHYNTYFVGGNSYNDVIQIDCGNSRGYYQRGHGEIAQE